MAYIGRDIEYGSFTKQTLTADSSTVAFALDQSVLDAKSLLVSVGGVIQEPDVAYTASGTTLTFTGTPVTGDPIWIVYLGKTLGLSSARGSVTYQAATGDGSATTVAMTSTGTTGTIIVTLNGVMQTPSTDFSVSGSTLTFTTAPFSGAAIGIYYISKKAKLAVPAAASIQTVDLAAGGALPAWDGGNLTGIVSIMKSDILEMQNNIALLNFLRSNDSTTKRLSMLNGFNDMFRNTTGVVGEGVNVSMVHLDGANVYLNANANHNPGFSNGKSFLINFWVKAYEDDKLGYFIGEYNGPHPHYNKKFNIYRDADNKINVMLGNASNVTFAHVKSTRTLTVADGATMITVAINMAAASAADRIQIRIGTNAVETLTLTISPPNDTIGIGTGTAGLAIGTDFNGTGRFVMDIGRFYIAEQYLDISVAANFAKLITTSGYPVDMGTDGSAVTGTAPKMFLNSAGSDFYINSGSGGTGNTDNNFYNWALSGAVQFFRIQDDAGYASNSLYSSNTFTNAYEIIEHYGKNNAVAGANSSVGNTADYWGICLTLAAPTTVTKVSFKLNRSGATAHNAMAMIMGATGTVGTDAVADDNVLAVSAGIAGSTITTHADGEMYDFTFEPTKLPAGNYWIGLYYPTGESGINLNIFNDQSSPTHAGNRAMKNNGSWSPLANNQQIVFYLYGSSNLDLITKGTDSLAEVDSPASAPTKGHLETIISGGNVITAKSYAPDVEDHGYSNSSLRVRYTATTSATRIRLKLKGALIGGSKSNTNLDNISIGNQSGTSYNCTTIPTEIFTGGSSGIFVQKGKYSITDWFDYTIVAGSSYLITFDFATDAANDDCSKHATAGDGAVAQGGGRTYNLANFGTIHATYASGVFCLDSVEVLGLPTINTDIIGEISRDGGTTYSPAVLSKIPKVINGSDYEILSGDVDFTGDPSGTNLVGRIRTVNKDKVTVNGIAVNWI